MTLVEFLVGSAVLVIAASSIAAVYIYFLRSFAGLENHMTMSTQGRAALDRFSRDIRQAELVASTTTNQLILRTGTNITRFLYDPDAKTVTRTADGKTETLLTGCASWKYEMFMRVPKSGTSELYVATNPASCKVLQLSWTCTRSILGTRLNVQDEQAAKIVIRKQKS
jgi:hypothetical protein